MSVISPISAILNGLALYGHSARTRIVHRTIGLLSEQDRRRLLDELEAHEQEAANDLARRIAHHLKTTPPSVKATDVAPVPEGDADPSDPLQLLRSAALGALSTK